MTGGARRPGRRPVAIGVLVAVPLAFAGCSAGPTPAPTLRPIVAGPTPTVTTYEVDTTAWIDGFIVTVGSATASLDPKGGTLTVQATIENAGADDATLDAPIVVTSGDATFQLQHGVALPDQPGGSVATVSLPFDVIGRGNVDDAVIRIGRAGEHTVAIPLKPAGDQTVRLEPVELEVRGTARTVGLRVTIHHVELRWDLPDWHTELPTATAALTITYDVSFTGTFSGGFAFTGDNVRLRMPDGKTYLHPRQDGHSQSIALINAGKTAKGLSSRFEVQDGVTGRFWLVVDDGQSTRSIPFVIGP